MRTQENSLHARAGWYVVARHQDYCDAGTSVNFKDLVLALPVLSLKSTFPAWHNVDRFVRFLKIDVVGLG